jgi:hypothetical protein
MPQEAAAIAAVVWRLVQSFVSAQPLRKTARIIQVHNLCLFMRLPSFNAWQQLINLPCIIFKE